MDYYRGKKVFITGGSSGIGKAAARRLAQWGADVWIAARGQARLDEALGDIQRAGRTTDQRFGATAVDISDPQAVDSAMRQVLEGLGGLDVLINNAGVAHPATVLDTPPEVYRRMMDINYFGTVHVTRALLPHFQAQRAGHICNVGSMLGFMGVYGYTAYAASKFAVTGFSECLRQELLPYGVGLTVVFPPDTDTPQLAEENKIKPPATKAITGEVKTLSAEAVAEAMLVAIAKGRYQVTPGLEGAATHWIYRHAPGAVRWFIDGALMRYERKHGSKG